ncbi:MAG: insulinase family protein, partial [Deltaproteobacteria bacterium]|nr:insulinase family protein [Deltaproteobacteria bacterium]
MKKSKVKIVAVLVALAAGCAGLTAYQLKLKPYQLEGADFPLPSGLRVFFQEDKGQPSVIVTSVVGVGSTAEPPGKEGMAHLIEHLNYRAKHGNNPKVMDHIKILGGEFNGWTAQDTTTYYVVAPKDALPALLEMEAKRMTDTLEGVTEEVLGAEREVVRNELRQRMENTMVTNMGLDALYEMLFPAKHPYHRSVIGTHETLRSITLDDVRAFVKKHYVPSNITIVVAGDFDRKQVGQILGRAFPRELLAAPGYQGKDLPLAEPKPRVTGPAAEPPPPADKSIRHIKGPVTSPTVMLGWSLPAAYRDDDGMMQIVVSNMTSAVSSMLYPEDIFDQQRIKGVGCFFEPGVHSSAALCIIALMADQDPDDIAKKAVDALWEQWDQAARGRRGRSLGRAMTSSMVSLFNESASLERAVSIASSMHFTGQPDYFSRSIAALTKTKELVAREFAYKYLNRERAVRLVIEPLAEDERNKSGVNFDTTGAWSGELNEESKDLDAAFAALTPDKVAQTAITPDLATIREVELSNGLRVVLKRHGNSPFVSAAMLVRGGYYGSNPPFMSEVSYTEHDARDPMQVAGRWSIGTADDYEVQQVSTPSGNLVEAIDLIATRVSTTRSSHDDEGYRATLKALARFQRDDQLDPAYWANRALIEALLPGHPLAQQDFDLNRLGALGKPDFEALLGRTLAPRNSTLFVVGDVVLDEAEKLVRERLEGWRAKDPGSELPALPPPPPPPSRQLFFLDEPNYTQAEIIMACQLVPSEVGNDAIRAVAVTALNDNLQRSIREQLGASYGVYAYRSEYRGGAAWMNISGTVQLDKTGAALGVILDSLKS